MSDKLTWRFTVWTKDGRGLPKQIGPFHATTKQAAMNQADRAWRGARIELEQINTGEKWTRNRGTWFLADPGHRHRAPAAEADGTHRP